MKFVVGTSQEESGSTGPFEHVIQGPLEKEDDGREEFECRQ
jgi:hypothetical protein